MIKFRLFTLGALTAFAATAALAQQPERVEYFFDSDPGYGMGTVVSGVQTGDNAMQLDLGALNPGSHLLCVRSQDSRGLWSTTMSRTIYITKVSPDRPVALEYFLDTDPGYGLGSSLDVAEGVNTLALDLTGTAFGSHLLCLRSRDNEGNWSTVMSRTLFVCEARGFTALEYFIDSNDPGEGNAVAVAVPSEWDDAFTFDVPTDGLSVGNHQLSVRGLTQAGVWSVISSEPFDVSESTGISVVTLTMPLGISASGSSCTVSGSASDRGDCLVEVFGVSGAKLASASWPASAASQTLPVSASRGTVLVVKVTDTQNGRTVVKRIVMQ